MMKTLILDIETSPNLAYVWGLWDQSVGLNQIEHTGSVICFAAKWHGQKKVMFHSDFHDGHTEMIEAAWALCDEADAIVHYNGRAFDLKHLRREFLLEGFGPPTPHRDIDLLNTVRQQFKFASNKLQHVSTQLGIGEKVQHSGFELWRGCMAGDAKAWAEMRSYNRQDVQLTEKLYDILHPWIRHYPNKALIEDRPDSCPRCAANGPFQARGYNYTNSLKYQRWFCKNCLGYFQSRKSEKATTPPQFK
jgi:hypothetical protein